MVEDRQRPQDFLLLTVPAFHEYAILKEVEVRTEGKVRLGSGTLYAIIKRLLTEGLIDEIDDCNKGGDDRCRYYRLSSFGPEVALAETERMEEMLMDGKARRMLRKPRHA